jgi:hypothetical protein
MRILKQAFAVTGALFVLAVALAFIAPQRVQAVAAALVQIVPGGSTHLGQYESNLVSLSCDVGLTYCIVNNPDGSNSTSAYTVPSGYTLVITDYEWLSYGDEIAGSVTYCDAVVGTTTGGSIVPPACAIADKNGFVFDKEHYTAGVRVASGVPIEDAQASFAKATSTIQGYLVPND